jgi:hypothetical protein
MNHDDLVVLLNRMKEDYISMMKYCGSHTQYTKEEMNLIVNMSRMTNAFNQFFYSKDNSVI